MASRPPQRRAASKVKFAMEDDDEDFEDRMREEDSGEEPEDQKEYCICKGKDDGSFMICCDKCENWYHGRCINLTAKQGGTIASFVCHSCRQVPVTQIVQLHGITPTQNSAADYEVNSASADGSEDDYDDDEGSDDDHSKGESKKRKREVEPAPRASSTTPPPPKRQKPPPTLPSPPPKSGPSEEVSKGRTQVAGSLVSALLKYHTTVPQDQHDATRKIADQIEQHLFAVSANLFDENYKTRFKIIATGITNPKNAKLRAQILSGELSPATLVRMTPDELKGEDALKEEKEREQKALEGRIKKAEDQDLAHQASLAVAQAGALGLVREGLEEPINGDKARGDGLGRTSSPKPLAYSSNQVPNAEPSELTDAAKAAIAAVSEMPTIDVAVDTSALKPIAPIITKTNSIGGESTDPLDEEWRGGREANVYWQGRINYLQERLECRTNAVHLSGEKIPHHLLPAKFSITNRVEFNAMMDYLPKLETSASRLRSVMYLTPGTETDGEIYEKLLTSLDSIKRAGVIACSEIVPTGITADGQDSGYTSEELRGMAGELYKEIYLLPITASAVALGNLPEFLTQGYSSDSQDRLMLVFVTAKQKPATPGVRQPSVSAPTLGHPSPALGNPTVNPMMFASLLPQLAAGNPQIMQLLADVGSGKIPREQLLSHPAFVSLTTAQPAPMPNAGGALSGNGLQTLQAQLSQLSPALLQSFAQQGQAQPPGASQPWSGLR